MEILIGLSDKLNNLMRGKNELRLLDLMAGILIGVSPIIHLIIVKKVNVPYGRFSSSSWGFLINVRVAWFLQEIPALTIPLYTLFTSPTDITPASLILIGLFIFHYAHRTLIYPFKIRGGKPTPISIAVLACIFCTYNGYMQSMFLLHHSNYSMDWIYQPNFIIGICLFAWGMKTNMICDSILRNLRKPGETGYKIPKGDMFEYVSCGNLFGETVEWLGFAIASWSLQAAAFAVFALLYLSARSYTNHQWYIKKFEDYPKDRKIFIPYLI
uniref:3-oxo-5-alpha-steroid 4-dehydrogenase 1-like n=1 Tax=Styela clava TaxID=7725 RepID=UPI00193961C8|nr:3-oxo-5-alpha-steroid 4-dehydrogenase 1-like [Styela clava]